ncbi:cysteine dioxygenase [Nakamurella multipartita]|uniref:Cysteine dioxygenase type I n=1 Tax=Nakamurella multipartita (strain ATCC 700099 / DSM 44233 / CIP 104796 / JCM 9543 / NBRC 105858 / Y-104) TaxID=479431 RepID=C8XDM9_NAKMY|nr:cysteine dioxygenase family protein [Nakamurella multipartita]ACV77693.1 cysteine dioxygenase type I [Nakamurella multipartita DSM 44233]
MTGTATQTLDRTPDIDPIDPAADVAGRLDGVTVAARQARSLAQQAGRLTLENLPGRDLDPDELVELASSVASDPGPLAPHIAFSDDKRHYVSLHRDSHVDVWLLCWTPENDTGWHDHDISSGAVAVLRGALTEHNLAVAQDSIRTDVVAGEVFGFGPDHIHRLTGRDPGSVSVHAYSPPLWRMGQYTLGPGGQLRRRAVSYADELRPLD